MASHSSSNETNTNKSKDSNNKASTTNKPNTNKKNEEMMKSSLVDASLWRLTEGLPLTELRMMEAEAKECEEALLAEIRILEEAIGVQKKDPPTLDKSKEREGGEASEKKEKSAAAGTDSSTKKIDSSTNKRGASSIATTATGWGYDTGGLNYFSTVDAILTSELTPPDRFFTVSALLGRLRDPLHTPPPPNSTLHSSLKKHTSSSSSSSKKSSSSKNKHLNEKKQKELLLEKQRALLALDKNPVYRREHTDTATLLSLWKRISSHRSAAVFRKPVNSREAPGYSDRILFPIDLSLIRKMITAGVILSFADLHQRIGLVCHNCVKFNGRESDYGIITREFEAHADDSIIAAVNAATDAASKKGNR